MGINRNKISANAQKYVHRGSWEKAIGQYQLLVDDDPRDVRSQLKIADLYSKLGRNTKALEGYEQVARFYAADEIYEKAAAVYTQALRLAPESPELHRDLGDAYHSLGRLKDAVRAYHKAQKIYKTAGDGARQIDILERMIALDAEDIGMRIQLAERYAKDGENTRALEHFHAAAERLDQEGRSDEFVQVAERIIFLRDEAPALRRRVIDIYLNTGQYHRALSHLQVCFKRAPQSLPILDRLAQAFEHLDRKNKAVMVLHEMANQQEIQSDDDERARIYKRILTLDPDNTRAHKRLQNIQLLRDSGALSPAPDTGTLKPRAQSPTPTPQSASVDALDGIEFLDEPSAVKVRASHHGQPPTPEQRHQESTGPQPPRDLADLTASAVPLVEPDEPADSADNLEEVEVIAPTIERDSESTEADAIARVLKETDVFIKYGLFDKAYETIVGVIARQPNSLGAHAQMARLQEARGNSEGAVDEFLEMARITRATPRRSERFVREAFALTNDSERVRRQAASLGIPLAPAQSAHVFSPADHDFAAEETSSLDESTAIPPGSRGHAEMPEHLHLPEVPTDEIDPLDDDYGEPDTSHTDRMEITDDMLAMNLDDLKDIDDSIQSIDEPGTQELELDDILFADALAQPTQDASFDDAGFEELNEDEFILLDLDDDEPVDTAPVEDDLDMADFDIADFEEHDFDESVFEDAELLEMDMDIEGLSELSDSQIGALQDEGAAQKGADFDLSVSGAEADMMFDELFGDSGSGGFGSTLGDDASPEEIPEADSFAQLGEREGKPPAAPSTQPNLRRTAPPSGPATHDDLQVSSNHPFGASSLSGKFVPAAEFEQSEGVYLGEDEAHNTSLELGLAYRDMGLFKEAIFEFNQALDDPDAEAAANFHIALCEFDLDKQAAAVERLTILLQRSDLPAAIRKAAQAELQGIEAGA